MVCDDICRNRVVSRVLKYRRERSTLCPPRWNDIWLFPYYILEKEQQNVFLEISQIMFLKIVKKNNITTTKVLKRQKWLKREKNAHGPWPYSPG